MQITAIVVKLVVLTIFNQCGQYQFLVMFLNFEVFRLYFILSLKGIILNAKTTLLVKTPAIIVKVLVQHGGHADCRSTSSKLITKNIFTERTVSINRIYIAQTEQSFFENRIEKCFAVDIV